MEQNLSVQKTNWVLYIITLIGSLLAILLLNGGLSLSTSFLDLNSFTAVYILIAIISLGAGFASALVLKMVAKSMKSFLMGGIIVSSLAAGLIFTSLIIQDRLGDVSQMGGIVSLFGDVPNAYIAGILILLFFNIPFMLLKNKYN